MNRGAYENFLPIELFWFQVGGLEFFVRIFGNSDLFSHLIINDWTLMFPFCLHIVACQAHPVLLFLPVFKSYRLVSLFIEVRSLNMLVL